ncbi:protein TIFY 10a-like isoform X2 [Wolffia australiana]
MENAAEMAERRGGERVSSFSVTCNRLSRYLRERGAIGDLKLSLSAMAADRPAAPQLFAGKAETPRTMNLLPGVEIAEEDDEREIRAPIVHLSSRSDLKSREEKKAQMTIFYGGKVVVIDEVPAEKAEELMIMAKRSAQTEAPSPSTSQPATPSPAQQKPSPAAGSGIYRHSGDPVDRGPIRSNDQPLRCADLPIARRVSLNRFLEKRKDRITAKGPYPVSGKREEVEKWLGLAAPPGELRLDG